MFIDTDMHSHVSRSSALLMIKAAQHMRLKVLGLSEHVFQMKETRYTLQHLEPEGPLLTFKAYIEDVRTAARQLNFDARLGMEVDFIPDKNESIHKFIQGYDWDFLIGSVHEIDGIQFEGNYKWSREEGEALWLRYFERMHGIVTSGHFSLISHPVRMRVKNPYIPPSFDEELGRLAAIATLYDVALEINGYDMLHYHSLVRRLANACVLHQTPMSVGSDAHIPEKLAQAHQQTENMMRELGITKIRLWKQMKAEDYTI